jgi:hypothetical protein
MPHLAQREECHHECNEVNNAIFGRVMHHEVHQHINANTQKNEKQDTRHKERAGEFAVDRRIPTPFSPSMAARGSACVRAGRLRPLTAALRRGLD